MNEKVNGVVPIIFSEEMLRQGEFHSASIVLNQHGGSVGIECAGRLQRESSDEISISDYMISREYAGCKMIIDDISDYEYLEFYGMKNQDHGQPSVYIYNEDNEVVAEFTATYNDLDNEWHQYLINVSKLSGRVIVIFNGGYVDTTGRLDSLYTFSNITLY